MASRPRLNIVGETASQSRISRNPQHTFHLRSRPWQIQPFLIAPVLPGETMKNLLLQSRVVTDPIANPLIGWWCEYYIFYVKHRDMYDRDLLTSMMLNPEADLSSLDAAAVTEHYHYRTTSMNWVALCLERVVDEYFRNEGENMATASIGALPAASINTQNWLDSVRNGASVVDTADEVLTDAGSEFGTAVNVSEVDAALRRYRFMRENNLTDMTYEDFLATYGVRPKAEELHRPELLRYLREWSYPSNTIDPTNGTPRSAVSWSIAERADKDRFFREPGFIFGVSVIRPKVYLKNIRGNAVDLLDDAYSWLPAVLRDDPATSLKNVPATTPPLTLNTDDYWVDVRDLYLYGDQFLNFDYFTAAIDAVDANIVALPSASLAKRYPASADADALFVNASPLNQVRQDGVVSLSILGREVDTTPTTVGTNITV